MLEKSADFFVSFFGQSDFCARNGISTLLRRILSATDFSQNLTERNKAMNITDIRIRKIYSENRLRALVSITVDHDLAVHDIKIIEGSERLFVAMPSRRDENGSFRDISHPITPQARHQLETAVLNAYRDCLSRTEELHTEEHSSCSPARQTQLWEQDPQNAPDISYLQ